MPLKRLTIDDVMKLNPCMSRNEVTELFGGIESIDALDVINDWERDELSAYNVLWVITHGEMASERTFRRFAAYCAREALKFVSPDPRYIAAIDCAFAHADGDATNDELAAMRNAAWYASQDAARRIVWAAVSETSHEAAWESSQKAAYAAAQGFAGVVAWDAVWKETLREQMFVLQQMIWDEL